ncbi:MAG TPA: 2-amino-4-hydroxy-6-hydroxymethyldihydropteridine diphosphokinase [Methylomirabilota bacterium]|nr:2-amino-4-hydroxy-6-hydroxymethyldihydropteridine diphosphokinase [Methylomirabilota bacterium]
MAFVALGSNLGDSARFLRAAVARLEEWSALPLLRSSFWRSTPVDCPPGSPPFVNTVVGLSPIPGETPRSLLGRLQALETELGRQPKRVVNEPRCIDLDLIAFGRQVMQEPDLILPHPRAHRRRFVLQPLAEIAPDWVLPLQTRSVRELLADLDSDEVLTLLEPAC